MVAATTITASVLVDFAGEDANFAAFVELDDREFGLNGGKTNFIPSQDVYLLLFKPTGYSVIQTLTTSGVLELVQGSTRDVDEFVQFVNEDSQSVRYPIDSSFSYQWEGDSPGVLSNTQFGLSLPTRGIDPNTQKPIPEYRAAVARIIYSANCEVWKLSGTPLAISQALLLFIVEKDTP